MITRTRPQLPPVPQPPHDPTWWQLDGRAGWHPQQSDGLDQLQLENRLVLALEPGSRRSLADGLGSFGGLTLPGHMAWGPDWSLYLLDTRNGTLKVFNPCVCRFEPVPYLGGKGIGPRHFAGPHGIAIRGDTLYLCDTGNHRLALFSLRGFLLRSEWSPPAEAGLAQSWEPCDVAFDRNGRAYVSDIANRCIHRFNAAGVWLGRLSGYSLPRYLTIDCDDRLYVLEAGIKPHVVQSSLEGTERTLVWHPAEVSDAFPAMPISVETKGWLDLGGLCGQAAAWFDQWGDPLPTPAELATPVYQHSGAYLSEPLDSGFHQCQWHRVVLQGSVPPGTRVRLCTYTADTPQPLAHILALPATSWQSNHTLHGFESAQWEGLITSAPGRYLWLSLSLESNGEATPVIDEMRIEFPRISLRRYLPAIFAEDPAGADFSDRMLSLFDTGLRQIETRLDHQAAWFDPMATPANPGKGDFLTWLAGWIGLTLDRQWPEEKRRRWVKRSAELFCKRGTRAGLHQQLLFYLGMEPLHRCCEEDQPQSNCASRPANCAPLTQQPCYWQAPPLILEHYQLRRWLFVGEGRLGDQAVLWGKRIVNRSQLDEGAQTDGTQLITTQDPLRDPFHVYAHRFSVFVPACFGHSELHRTALQQLIEMEKPAHTHHRLIYVEPRFRIGFQSSIGLDAVVGRYPEGVTLGGGPLGRATVLDVPAHKRGGPSLAVGVQARVGSSTELN